MPPPDLTAPDRCPHGRAFDACPEAFCKIASEPDSGDQRTARAMEFAAAVKVFRERFGKTDGPTSKALAQVERLFAEANARRMTIERRIRKGWAAQAEHSYRALEAKLAGRGL